MSEICMLTLDGCSAYESINCSTPAERQRSPPRGSSVKVRTRVLSFECEGSFASAAAPASSHPESWPSAPGITGPHFAEPPLELLRKHHICLRLASRSLAFDVKGPAAPRTFQNKRTQHDVSLCAPAR